MGTKSALMKVAFFSWLVDIRLSEPGSKRLRSLTRRAVVWARELIWVALYGSQMMSAILDCSFCSLLILMFITSLVWMIFSILLQYAIEQSSVWCRAFFKISILSKESSSLLWTLCILVRNRRSALVFLWILWMSWDIVIRLDSRWLANCSSLLIVAYMWLILFVNELSNEFSFFQFLL